MGRDHMRSRSIWWWCVVVTVLSLALSTSGQGCTTDLSSKSKFPTVNLPCKSYPVGSYQFHIWALKDNATQVTSIVYAAPLTANNWAGLGFSADGQMVGGTALISTLNATGAPDATLYSLNGRSTAQVVASTGNGLSFVGGAPEPTYDAAAQTVYVSMQVDFRNSTATPTFLLMAYGRQFATGQLAQHDSKVSTSAQFLSGVVAPPSAASNLDRKAKIHGSLNILGWGLLLPVGAMVVRYARRFDPAWFYAHIAFQITGFACIVGGVAIGVELARDVQPEQLNSHRGLGIFLFVLAILQILAVVLRPKKNAKVRKYWNWYHHWVGRLALFLAVINIFVGLRMGSNVERDFKVGYISILAIELAAFAVLEILLWLRWNRQHPIQQTSDPENQGFQFGGSM